MVFKIVCSLLLLVSVSANDYFQLRAAGGGCIGRPSASAGRELLLKSCDFSDPTVMWRWDMYGRFHSQVNDGECIQAEQSPDILLGPDFLEKGTQMYVKPCKEGAGTVFQSFDDDWEFAGLTGPLFLNIRPDLCMTHFGAVPVIGESRIMLSDCASLGSTRGEGWTAFFPSYFVLTSYSGGCIARRSNGNDELFLQRCTGNDPNIQWRIDDMGRLRSMAADNECMQVEQRPDILAGPQALEGGTSVYVKPCGGLIKDDFQIFNTLFPIPLVYPPEISGPLSLISRPDLCVVHFGATPTIGQSRIMVLECDALGGNRALGWMPDNPCNYPPFCL
ncbi:expressed unknown protein [Seminavis robusta]|uniref:Ricin B lectin domain-containing protein n=1 Tax=Seminavis robusta TaxID=568900 RepID=A0A9N8EJB5_9STRA|nr:expressed unknown protein [Seminavis robusta]|eukprot:Sro1334_g263830.1 n/a (333) ;mRNA; r:21396-22394